MWGLAEHAHPDGTAAWPSVATLAEYAGCSERTVQRALASLLDEGKIVRGDQQFVSHYRPDRRPVVYDVVLESVPAGRPRGDTGDRTG